MSRWISCDDVFERLTRGPFPGNAEGEDACVEAHLAVCHECRMLAEALRPAVSAMQLASAFGPTSVPSLPEYRGRLPALCDGSSDAASVAAPPDTRVEPPLRDRVFRTALGWPVALALALGVIVGAMAAGGWFERSPRTARQWAWTVGPVDHTRTLVEANAVLGSLDLQFVCWNPRREDGAAEARADAGLRCCTECHFARSTRVHSVDMARLSQACVACHR